MVQLNVSQQLKAPVGSTWSYRVNEPIFIADGEMFLEGKLELTRLDCSLLARCALHTEIDLTCSRCLSVFTSPLTLKIEEEYFPTNNIFTGARLPLPDEPGSFTIDANNILDLTEAVRQYALLAIPMKPLCREDCAGLCPACGINLNKEACQCPAKPLYQRWAKLARLVNR